MNAPNFVRNQSELATALRVSRQLIAYHVKQPGSPIRSADGRYNVQEWRQHFAVHGRVNTRQGRDDSPDDIRERLKMMTPHDRVLILALAYFSEHLPQIVDAALSHTKISQPKRNMITLRLWANLARIVILGTRNPDDGTDIIPIVIPDSIKALAKKCKIILTEAALENLLS